MQIQITNIDQDIRTFLIDEFLSGDSEILTEDVPLLGNVIDSQGVIELVAFIQQRFKIEIEDDEVSVENLESMRSVVALIERKIRDKR